MPDDIQKEMMEAAKGMRFVSDKELPGQLEARMVVAAESIAASLVSLVAILGPAKPDQGLKPRLGPVRPRPEAAKPALVVPTIGGVDDPRARQEAMEAEFDQSAGFDNWMGKQDEGYKGIK